MQTNIKHITSIKIVYFFATSVNKNLTSSIVTFTFQKWEDIDVDWINIFPSKSIVAHEIAQIVLDADNLYQKNKKILVIYRGCTWSWQAAHCCMLKNGELWEGAMMEVMKTYLA